MCSLELNQAGYSSSLMLLRASDFSLEKFTLLCGQVAYNAHLIRPDAAFPSAKLSQVQPDKISREHVLILNQAVNECGKNTLSLTIPRLDLENF